MDFFQKGVFARLVSELGRRGQQVQVLSSAPSSRLKRNPLNPERPAPLIKYATFILSKYPDVHFFLTSSTIDAYGRANMMDLHEAVNERDLLKQILDEETLHNLLDLSAVQEVEERLQHTEPRRKARS